MTQDFKSEFNDLQPKRKPRLDGAPADLVIRAYVWKDSQYRDISFRASAVEYIYKVDDNKCSLVLGTGLVIPVRRSLDKVEKSIFFPDTAVGETLDLTTVTGNGVETKLTIKMYVHGSEKEDYTLVTFSNEDIDMACADLSTKHIGYLVLMNQSPLPDHFGFWFDMPRSYFFEKLSKAKLAGMPVLDLTEETKRRSSLTGLRDVQRTRIMP